MDFSKYVNKMGYPNKDKYTTVGYVDTTDDTVVWLSKREVVPHNYIKFKEKINKEAYDAYYKEYYTHDAELHDTFFKDLLKDYGLPDNKFSQALLDYAWSDSDGGRNGLRDVAEKFSEYYNLYHIAEETFTKEK